MIPESSSAAECAKDTGRAVSIVAHIKDNNVAYLLGMLLAAQFGLLDKVFTYGSGICS